MGFKPKNFVQNQATEALKKQIYQKGLIDTWEMYYSTSCLVEIDEYGVMTVRIFSTDYLKYLFDEWHLYDFTSSGSWVWAAYAQWTAYKVEQNPMLNWKVNNPKIEFEFMN